jgi:hypothetical protein
MSGLAVAQLPTHELISTIAAENITLASILGLSSRNPAAVTAVKLPPPLSPNRTAENVKAFWGPLGLPDAFPAEWD